jgi:hypothetical protein
MTTYASRTISVSIDCPPERVYAFAVGPGNFPRWATSFVQGARRTETGWLLDTPAGPIGIRFVERNLLGVLDHYVTPAPGVEIYSPMRVVANGSGSEVSFTLFQLPDTPEDRFEEDAAMVARDLATLKRLLERAAPA